MPGLIPLALFTDQRHGLFEHWVSAGQKIGDRRGNDHIRRVAIAFDGFSAGIADVAVGYSHDETTGQHRKGRHPG